MRHLTITYNDVTIFDGQVDEFTWSDSDGGILVKGGVKRAPAGGGLGGLLGAMAGARRQQTENIAAARQLELNDEAPPQPKEE